MIYGFRAGEKQTGSVRKVRQSIYGWAKVVSLLPEDPKHILISFYTYSRWKSDLLENRQERSKVNITQNGKIAFDWCIA